MIRSIVFGALGVQRSEHEVTSSSRGQRKFDRFQIPHFSDKNYVRIFAERTAQSGGKRLGMHSDFPVIHQ